MAPFNSTATVIAAAVRIIILELVHVATIMLIAIWTMDELDALPLPLYKKGKIDPDGMFIVCSESVTAKNAVFN